MWLSGDSALGAGVGRYRRQQDELVWIRRRDGDVAVSGQERSWELLRISTPSSPLTCEDMSQANHDCRMRPPIRS